MSISSERLTELVRMGADYDDVVFACRPIGKPIKKVNSLPAAVSANLLPAAEVELDK